MSQLVLFLEIAGVLGSGIAVTALLAWIAETRPKFASRKSPMRIDTRLQEILSARRRPAISSEQVGAAHGFRYEGTHESEDALRREGRRTEPTEGGESES